MYSTSYRGANPRGDGPGGPGGAGVGAPAGPAPAGQPSTHLPLNNGCSRVVNHFAPTCTAKKHVNIEREKLAAGGGTAPPNHYQDDIDTEEEEHESGEQNDQFRLFPYTLEQIFFLKGNYYNLYDAGN